MSRLLLVPFVQFDDSGNKKDVYTGLYNVDIAAIKTIEPDEDGDTVIYHRFGPAVILKLPCHEFLKFIANTYGIDITLMPFIEEYDDKIVQFLLNNNN